MLTVTVALSERSYEIHIGSGLLKRSDLWVSHCKGNQVAIVTNTTIAPLYLAAVSDVLRKAGKSVVEIILPDGEIFKQWESIEKILNNLLAEKFNRNATLVALGGGVIGDMAGFAASIYMRGIGFIQIPTTLLAQVDSSVGGKTGINHPAGKNMIGSFYQPQVVVVDTDTLNTLPDRELSAGLAEILKHGLIRDADYFEWTANNLDAIFAREAQVLAQLISRSVEIKSEIVAQDERESGLRAILNFGHTFGHAIEAGLGYGVWLHGEAVGAGMVLASAVSERLGYLTQPQHQRNVSVIESARLPIDIPKFDLKKYHELMAIDKKASDAGLQFILLRAIGNAVVQGVPSQVLDEVLEAYSKSEVNGLRH